VSDLTQLIRAALDCGVQLRYVDGQVKASGKRSALQEWAPRLRPYRQQLIEALQPADPWEIDWQFLAAVAEYHGHHFKCATCIASGKGYGLRCGVGASPWIAYSEAG